MSPKIQRKSQKSLLLAQKAEIVLKFHAPFYFSGCLLQEPFSQSAEEIAKTYLKRFNRTSINCAYVCSRLKSVSYALET